MTANDKEEKRIKKLLECKKSAETILIQIVWVSCRIFIVRRAFRIIDH